MALTADIISDRRRLKRRLGVWRVVAVAAVAAVIVMGLSAAGLGVPAALDRKNHIALVEVNGIITDDRARARLLADIAKDDDAQALIVRIDSPGGTVVGGEALYAQLRDVAAAKPVVAVLRDLGTSAAYMTALGSDHIIASPGTITGSIGVIVQTADVSGLLDSIGIKPEAITSGALKGQPSPFEPLSEAGRAAMQSMIDDVYQQFIDLVVTRRDLDAAGVRSVADGRVFTGRQALELGLVDALGGEDDARDWLAANHDLDPDLPVRTVKPRRGSAEVAVFLSQLVGNSLFSERLQLDGLISVWHPAL